MARRKVTIPIVGSQNWRSSSTDTDQTFYDCYWDVFTNEATGTRSYEIRSRPVLTDNGFGYPSAASGAGTAILGWLGTGGTQVITAFGNTNSTIYVDNTSLGAITGQAIHLSETQISGVANFLAISNSGGGRTWYYPNGGALTEITDVDFPPKQTPARTITGNFVHRNGKAYVMCTDGTIWESDVNSLANWTSTSFLTAQDSPDSGVGLGQVKNYVLGFGQTTIEFFKDTGNPTGSSLSRIDGTTIRSSILNQHCILNAMDTVVWAATDGPEGPGVYILNGFTAKKISQQGLDRLISDLATSNVRLHNWILGGHEFILVSTADSNTDTSVYDIKTGRWSYWNISCVEFAKTSHVFSTLANISVGIGSSSTKYLINDTLQSSAVIRTSRFNFGTRRRKIMWSLRLIGDFWNAPTATISWSDTDYASQSSAYTLDLSNPEIKLVNLGQFIERSIQITWQGTNRIQAFEFEIEDCET